jgi:hypothetical protein
MGISLIKLSSAQSSYFPKNFELAIDASQMELSERMERHFVYLQRANRDEKCKMGSLKNIMFII